MSHQHFLPRRRALLGVRGNCLARRRRRAFRLHACGLPLEGFDHSACDDPIELLSCPEHRGEERRRTEEAKKENDRQRAESGLDEKWAWMKALAVEIVEWLFR